MTKLLNIARQYCSNWNAGKCVGCMFVRKDGKLTYSVNSKLSGKNCSFEDGCEYFETIVIPGIDDDKIKQKAKLLRKL